MKSKKHKNSSSIMVFLNLGLSTSKLHLRMIKRLGKGTKKMKLLARVRKG